MAITDFRITTNWQEKDWFHPLPHTGIDLATPTGTRVFSQDDAIVSLTIDNFLGNTIRLKLNNGNIIVYGHMSKFEVENGQFIKAGDLIGLTGGDPSLPNQGKSTGPHIHISQYKNGQLVDPTDYLFNRQLQQNDSSPFLFPVMLILLLVILWKFKKLFAYFFTVVMVLTVIFLVS